MLLFVLSGLFLLRLAERMLFSLLFHEPPRSMFSGVPTSGNDASGLFQGLYPTTQKPANLCQIFSGKQILTVICKFSVVRQPQIKA